jgi:effector-binding domain-containing protein
MGFVAALAVIVALILVAAVFWYGGPRGPSLEEVGHLQTPQILEMKPQKVLQVRAKGDPNKVARLAFGLLMKAYFSLKGVPRSGPAFKPPRGRWPVDSGLPPEEWEGQYAMPVPDRITEVPKVKEVGGLKLELDTWEYGSVAQILHLGGYDQEAETVDILKDFVASEGYEIAGIHEEEYLKGPGFLFAGNPERYLTLIRYPVRKAAEAE